MRKNSLLFWDLLVLLLVILPVVTGGIWIRRPGLFVELSDPGIPVLLVGALGLFLWRMGISLRDSFAVRLFGSLFGKWKSALSVRPVPALLAAGFAVAAFWALISVLRHLSFQTGSHDLGIFTNAIWNLIQGNGYISSVKHGMNLFADHQSPIFWAWAPVFALFPRPETLLVTQALILASGGVLAWLLARQYLPRGHWGTAALPLLYWAYPPVRSAVLFDFHPEAAMLPLFLGAIVGLQSPRSAARLSGAAAFLAALACKESAGPVAVGIGAAWLLGAAPVEARARCRRIGAAAVFAGFAAFLVNFAVVPRWLGFEYAYQSAYSHLGDSVPELLLSPFRKPTEFFGALLSGARLKFLVFLLGPLAFVSLLFPRALAASVPALALLLLSRGDLRVNPEFHYGIEPAIGVLWAWPAGLASLERRLRGPALAGVWVLFFALGLHGRSEPFKVRQLSFDSHRSWVRSRLLPCVAPGVSIAARDALIPHLAARPWIHDLTRLVLADGAPVSCVVNDPELPDWQMSPERVATLERELSSLGYREAYRCGSLSVREREPGGCLRCQPRCD